MPVCRPRETSGTYPNPGPLAGFEAIRIQSRMAKSEPSCWSTCSNQETCSSSFENQASAARLNRPVGERDRAVHKTPSPASERSGPPAAHPSTTRFRRNGQTQRSALFLLASGIQFGSG